MPTQESPQQRFVAFDNLRYLMVLLVIVFHAGASYTAMVAFWPFHDSHTSDFVEVLTILLDTFMMTVLFFVAGYFALPSLQKKGGKEFLKSKLRHLGIPWLVVTLCLLPLLDYLHYVIQAIGSGSQPQGYGTHWLLSMGKMLEFYVGPMQMSEHLNMTEHFYQRYMWFLSSLLLFFVLFWLFYEIAIRCGWKLGPVEPRKPSSSKSVYSTLAWVGSLSMLMFAVVKIFASSPADPLDLVWFSLGNIIQLQLAKLAFYIPSFGLGVYAFSREWFANGRAFGRPGRWAWAVLVLMVINMLVARTMVKAEEPPLVLQIAFLGLYPLWTLSFLGFFISLATKQWNSASNLGRELASHSYNMYLAHYVFVMTLPLLLSTWIEGHALIKFGLVSIMSIVLSYLTSRYLIKPRPRALFIGLISVNIFLPILG